MLTFNIIDRVFRIYHNGKTATGYVVEFHGVQHLVSASHVFEGSNEISTIGIYQNDSWNDMKIKTVYNSGLQNGDTIVFLLEHDIAHRNEIKLGHENAIYGSWCYILGFPLGISINGGPFFSNYPMPFVKACLLSALDPNSKHGISQIYLDGHNNQGFSGAPVVYCPPNQIAGIPAIPQIIGTVSGHLNERPISSATREEIDYLDVNAGIIKANWIRGIETKIPKGVRT